MELKKIIIKVVTIQCDVCHSSRKITLVRYRCPKEDCDEYEEHTKKNCIGCNARVGLIVEDNGCSYCEVS